MQTQKAQLELILEELKTQVIDFVEADQLENAQLFLEQYLKFAPKLAERYTLEALVKAGRGELDQAEAVLREGLALYPRSFDLLYNLGYILQQKSQILEAYDIYMKARYLSESEAEKSDVAAALKSMVQDIRSGTVQKGDQIGSRIKAGEVVLTVVIEREELERRQVILAAIEANIGSDFSSVLEIGFREGAISKNLNYYGYDLTAVDRVKEQILQVIAGEWHDNILHPEQKVAKFYHEQVDLEWLGKIPQFEVIIAVGGNNRQALQLKEGERRAALDALLARAGGQLFILASAAPSSGEFTQEELREAALAQGAELRVLAEISAAETVLELCVLEKEPVPKRFTVPDALAVSHSRSTIFEVEVAKCVDLYGAGYLDDWHPFVAALQEHRENPDLKYEHSILKQYYEQFRPSNLEQALFSKKGRAQRLERGFIGLPWFWNRTKKVVFQDRPGETRPGGNHFFGPNSEKFGKSEWGRLTHLLPVLENLGYRPQFFSDGYISGYLLIKGGDYRFVVTEGQHRMACLAVLGYEKIRCRFTMQPQYNHLVLFEDAKHWPQVANGVFSRNLALKMFERFFMKNVGRERLGLPGS